MQLYTKGVKNGISKIKFVQKIERYNANRLGSPWFEEIQPQKIL